jgi:hypothetical protein
MSLRLLWVATICLLTVLAGAAPAAAQCQNIQGAWEVATLNGAPADDIRSMRLSQNGCEFSGSFDNAASAPIRHTVSGVVNGRMTIVRVDPSGCSTRMFGAIASDGSNFLWEIDRTEGKCGLPADHHEIRTFYLMSGSGYRQAAAPFLARVVRGVLSSTEANPAGLADRPGAGSRGETRGPGQAQPGGGGGRPADRARDVPTTPGR